MTPLAASQTQTVPPRRQWARLAMRVGAALLALTILVGATWAIHRWATYPDVPDVAEAGFDTSVAFLGSEDFSRMFEGHRKRYVLSIVDSLKDKPFEELVRLMLERDAARQKAARNVMNLKDRGDVEDAFGRLFIDKFYEQPKLKRDMYLMMFVSAERLGRRPGDVATTQQGTGAGQQRRNRGEPPSPERFKEAFARFTTRQAPQTQAKIAQFFMDVRKQQEIMGIK